MSRMKEGKDDVEISMKIELICLILKIDLMTLMTLFSQMAKMAVNGGVKAVG